MPVTGREAADIIRIALVGGDLSPELIGVILGGSIGLATAVLGHAIAWFQLRSSREFNLRQTVYIEAAASMAKGLEFFTAVTPLDIEDGQLAALIHPTSIAMYSIHVVATPSTIAALSRANQSLTLEALELTKTRAQLRSAIAAADKSGQSARGEIGLLQKQLFIQSMRGSLRYQRELVEVNIAARRELGLSIDESEYRNQNRTAEQAIEAAIERTIRELETLQPDNALESTARG